jgi:hypothetical protein
MILTNGHCYEGGFLDPGQAVVGKASTRTFDLLTADGRGSLGTLQAKEVVYATMTSTDVTLYKLDTTFDAIEAQYHVAPLTIADQHPVAGAPIRVVSGFWRKIYACSIDKFVYELHEANWTFDDSIRYTEPGCEVIGGTSGSPVVDLSSKLVVGINNTTNESGQSCTLDNPCEVDQNGKTTATKGASYGQELHQIYNCLTPTNDVDLDLPGCLLQKPGQ